ncbi:DoxX family protein [Pseudonocardia sp. TRM90224]|uniref:DoxX family protein n=1 Tax=Pseudonocardia sp. TRM90224 TaxID=2812678 RepID=UPI001E5B4CAB|nr:DoxX family protein [Pseudonocardia sp. TRM90224]
MAPLVALVVVTAVLLGLGALGVRPLRSWSTALRGGLAAMFLLTGGAHFIGMRAELIAMVPPVLPAPELLVTVTGVLELAGAVGLLVPRTARAAAACLTALLVVMFPANVYALLNGIGVASDPFDALVPRTILQVVFVAATVAVVWALRPATRTAALQPA